MNPFVSVIVPVYNVEPYLARCLDSIIGQTLRDIEIICVNDHSTDGSLSILRRYAIQDPRIRIVENKEREGQSISRNKGIDVACGEYIAFVDSDDWIEKDGLRVAYEEGIGCEADIVFLDFEEDFEDWNAREYFPCLKRGKLEAHNGVFDGVHLFGLFSECGGHYDVVWRSIYRNSFLKKRKIKFYPQILHEDTLFYFQTLLLARKTICSHVMFYHYFRRKGSTTFTLTEDDNLKSLFVVYMEFVRFLEDYSESLKLTDYVLQYIHSFYLTIKETVSKMTKEELGSICFNQSGYNAKFNLLCYEMENGLMNAASKESMDEIMAAQYLLVYGAGKIGRETVDWLMAHGIHRFDVAVSDDKDKCYLAGNMAKGISEYLPMRNRYLVLVAVGAKFRKEVETTLREFGFKYVTMR